MFVSIRYLSMRKRCVEKCGRSIPFTFVFMIFAKKATIGSFIFLALVAPQLASALAVMGGNGAYYNWQTSTSYWFDLSTGNSAVLPIASQPA